MYRYAMKFDKPPLFAGLHCASFLGIVEILAALVFNNAGMHSCGDIQWLNDGKTFIGTNKYGNEKPLKNKR